MIDYLDALGRRAFIAWARRRTGKRGLGAVGRGSVILPPATILSPARVELGDQVLIFERATFSLVEEHRGRRHTPRLRIGDRCVIAHTVWFSCVGEIEIEADVLIGHNVLVADSFHEYQDRDMPILRQPMAEPRGVRIGAGSIVGPGAVLLAGTRLGRGCYVVPGAVVAGEIPAHSVLAGNPAEIIRRWDAASGSWVDCEDPRWSGVLSSLGPSTPEASRGALAQDAR